MSKLVKACIALAAFVAFAVVPASAFAVNDAVLEQPTGTPIVASHASPVPILGTNTESTVMTNAAGETLVSCNKAEVTGNLETNTGTPNFIVEGTVHKAEFTECSGLGGVVHANANPGTNGLPWCLRSTGTMTTHEVQVRGNGCTSESRPIRFVLNVTALGSDFTCIYQRANPISGTYTTHPSDAIVHIKAIEFNRTESSIFCPIAGFLDMTFTLERETTGVGNDPIYIKNHS